VLAVGGSQLHLAIRRQRRAPQKKNHSNK